MAKKVEKKLKLVIPAGQAQPNQQIGPALGQAGINIGEFIKRFNEGTAQMAGDLIPVEINVYTDRTFDLVYKTPPASSLILKAIKLEKGSGKNATQKVGKISKTQIREIAEKKMPDLNTTDLAAAEKSITGTARSMGVEVI